MQLSGEIMVEKHPLLVDMAGRRVGSLTVVERFVDPDSKTGSARWLCICDCGHELVIRGSQLRLAEREGKPITCSGCKTHEDRPRRTCKRRRPKGQMPKICPMCAGLGHRVIGAACDKCGRLFWPDNRSPFYPYGPI